MLVVLYPPNSLRCATTQLSVTSFSVSKVIGGLLEVSTSFLVPSWSEPISSISRVLEDTASSAEIDMDADTSTLLVRPIPCQQKLPIRNQSVMPTLNRWGRERASTHNQSIDQRMRFRLIAHSSSFVQSRACVS
jgi:hypothetical protein